MLQSANNYSAFRSYPWDNGRYLVRLEVETKLSVEDFEQQLKEIDPDAGFAVHWKSSGSRSTRYIEILCDRTWRLLKALENCVNRRLARTFKVYQTQRVGNGDLRRGYSGA